MTTSMGLSGDLQVLPLLDTLSVLSRHRKTGRLVLRTDSEEIIVYFERGSVKSVSTSDPSLRIGQVLVDQGFVSDEQIEQALALQSVVPHPDRIGDVLVDVGYVTPEQINIAVAAQLEAAIFRVLTQNGGTFEYVSEPPPPGRPVLTELDFEPLVLNATYLADKWLAERKPIDVDTLPEDLIDPAVLDRLSPSEREVLRELVGVYSGLHQLAWRIGTSARQYKHTVERLLESALVRIALEATEDEQATGRANARNESVALSDELIDPWILDELDALEKEILILLLNGVTSMQTLARESGRDPEMFNQSIERLAEERLVTIETTSESEADDVHVEAIVNEAFKLPDDVVPVAAFDELSHAERQSLIALLNGASTLQEMANRTGLPLTMFRDGTTLLVERGFLLRADPEADTPGNEPARNA